MEEMATNMPNMPEKKENPLKKHFRTPEIYLKLPSEGRFWPLGALERTETGEYPVYPMTARDEIVFNNPDALMNGQAVVDVIQSCVPNIKNAWEMPSLDVDAVLIAIRLASIGEKMDFDTVCPACKEENRYEIDLRRFLERTVNTEMYDHDYEIQDLTFSFRPLSYRYINQMSIESYETNKLVRIAESADLSEEEKIKRYNEIVDSMANKTLERLSDGIESIVTPDGVKVTENDFIEELIVDNGKIYRDISKIIDNNTDESQNDVDIVCSNPECKHEYKVPFTFDNANFFG